jgi:hypothetical protein
MYDYDTITAPAITPTIRERVERGAAWLDSVKPSWRNAVNVRILDVSESVDCVLGQVFAYEAAETDPYWSGFEYVLNSGHFKDAAGGSLTGMWAMLHAFDNSESESYAVLTAAWQRYLTPGMWA